MTRRRLRVFPSTDRSLAHEIDVVLSETPAQESEAELVALVTARLRGTYRMLTIHPQNRMADIEGNRDLLWYVFRDGRMRSQDDPRLDRLYAAMSSARETTRTVNATMRRAKVTAANAGYPVAGQATPRPRSSGRPQAAASANVREASRSVNSTRPAQAPFVAIPIEPAPQPELLRSEADDRN